MPTANQPYALRRRIHSIIEVGAPDDRVSRAYDFINMLTIVVNLICSIAYTYENVRQRFGPLLLTIEAITVAFFAIDYLLRLVTALLHKAAVSMHYSPASSGVLFFIMPNRQNAGKKSVSSLMNSRCTGLSRVKPRMPCSLRRPCIRRNAAVLQGRLRQHSSTAPTIYTCPRPLRMHRFCVNIALSFSGFFRLLSAVFSPSENNFYAISRFFTFSFGCFYVIIWSSWGLSLHMPHN